MGTDTTKAIFIFLFCIFVTSEIKTFGDELSCSGVQEMWQRITVCERIFTDLIFFLLP